MKLSIQERLTLIMLLPKEGDIFILRIAMDLQRELGFSDEEQTQIELRQENGQFRWKEKADPYKDIHLGEAGHTVIRQALQKLNEQKKLTIGHVPLYEKFVERISGAE